MAFKYTCVSVTLNISSIYIVVGASIKFSSVQSYMSIWLLYAIYIFMTSVSPSVCWCICYPPLDVYHTDYQWFTGKHNNLTRTYISQRGGQLNWLEFFFCCIPCYVNISLTLPLAQWKLFLQDKIIIISQLYWQLKLDSKLIYLCWPKSYFLQNNFQYW